MAPQYRNPAKHLTWPDINHCALSHAIFTWLSTAGAKVVWVRPFFVILFPLFPVLFMSLSVFLPISLSYSLSKGLADCGCSLEERKGDGS